LDKIFANPDVGAIGFGWRLVAFAKGAAVPQMPISGTWEAAAQTASPAPSSWARSFTSALEAPCSDTPMDS
jgi:hypothetical protein